MSGTITTKKPMIKETVGAQYYAFNNPAQGVEYDSSSYEENVTKTETVKQIGVTENMESTPVKASGKDYTTVNQTSSIDLAVESVAVVPDDLARMRGENINNGGLITSGSSNKRPYFAYGKVVKKNGGGIRYEWFPKCQLVENTDDIATKEENFSEQNDTLTIRAYPFNDAGDIKNYVDSEAENFPSTLTEDAFFSKPIINQADLTSVIPVTTPGA